MFAVWAIVMQRCVRGREDGSTGVYFVHQLVAVVLRILRSFHTVFRRNRYESSLGMGGLGPEIWQCQSFCGRWTLSNFQVYSSPFIRCSTWYIGVYECNSEYRKRVSGRTAFVSWQNGEEFFLMENIHVTFYPAPGASSDEYDVCRVFIVHYAPVLSYFLILCIVLASAMSFL